MPVKRRRANLRAVFILGIILGMVASFSMGTTADRRLLRPATPLFRLGAHDILPDGLRFVRINPIAGSWLDAFLWF